MWELCSLISTCRLTLSSNDMKLLQPENERIGLDPLPFKDVEEPAPSPAANSESLPLCMRDGHPENVKAETNTRDDEAAVSPRVRHPFYLHIGLHFIVWSCEFTKNRFKVLMIHVCKTVNCIYSAPSISH